MYLKCMIHGQLEGFFEHFLPDPRLERRAEKLLIDLVDYGNAVVNKFCKTHTERIGAYRMLGNQSFDHDDLAGALYRFCKKNVSSGHLIGIQDTTEMNFTNHGGRIYDDLGIGPITHQNNVGFFCHPMLVIDPNNQMPIGISSVNIWNRSWETKNRHERDYKNQNIREKESFKWIRSANETKELLDNASCLTIIGDRESDIYEEFVLVPDDKTHLLVRSSYDRKLFGEKKNLFEKLSSSPLRATYKLDVPAGSKRMNDQQKCL